MSESSPKYDVFQAIADPTRRKLLKLIGDKEMHVTGLTEHFSISRTAVSKHLRVLSEAGLIAEKKVGRETRYTLQPEPLLELKRWLSYYELYWENKVLALKHLVEKDENEPAVTKLTIATNEENDEKKLDE